IPSPSPSVSSFGTCSTALSANSEHSQSNIDSFPENGEPKKWEDLVSSFEEEEEWCKGLLRNSVPCGLYQPFWINCKIYIKPVFTHLKKKKLLSHVYQANLNSRYLYDT